MTTDPTTPEVCDSAMPDDGDGWCQEPVFCAYPKGHGRVYPSPACCENDRSDGHAHGNPARDAWWSDPTTPDAIRDPLQQCSHREEVATGEIYFCVREARHVGFHRYYDIGCANTDSCPASVHISGCPVDSTPPAAVGPNVRIGRDPQVGYDGLNHAGRIQVVPVVIDPGLEPRGEARTNPYGAPQTIVLRESNEQVLLHEVLHLIVDDALGGDGDSHHHSLVTALEVGLTTAGYRLETPPAVGPPEVRVGLDEQDRADLRFAFAHWHPDHDEGSRAYEVVERIVAERVDTCVAIHEGIRAQAVREAKAQGAAEGWDEGMKASADWRAAETLASQRRLPTVPIPPNPYTLVGQEGERDE